MKPLIGFLVNYKQQRAKYATQLGFPGVLAGPLVRSSYRAGRLWAQTMSKQGRVIPKELAHLAELPMRQAVRSA